MVENDQLYSANIAMFVCEPADRDLRPTKDYRMKCLISGRLYEVIKANASHSPEWHSQLQMKANIHVAIKDSKR